MRDRRRPVPRPAASWRRRRARSRRASSGLAGRWPSRPRPAWRRSSPCSAAWLAGVPVVPIAPDSGPLERTHILARLRRRRSCVRQRGRRRSRRPADRDHPGGRRRTGDLANPGAPRRPGRHDPLHERHHRAAQGGGRSARRRSPPTSTPWPRRGRGRPTTCWCTGCRCSMSTGWSSGVLGPLRVGSRLVHTGRPTPGGLRGGQGRGGSLFFGVPTVWSRVAADADGAAGGPARRPPAGVGQRRACRSRCSSALAALAGQGPIERYGMTETLITISGRSAGPRRAGWVGRPAARDRGPPGRRARRRPVPADGDTRRRARGPRPDPHATDTSTGPTPPPPCYTARRLVAHRRRGVRRPPTGGTASSGASPPT